MIPGISDVAYAKRMEGS